MCVWIFFASRCLSDLCLQLEPFHALLILLEAPFCCAIFFEIFVIPAWCLLVQLILQNTILTRTHTQCLISALYLQAKDTNYCIIMYLCVYIYTFFASFSKRKKKQELKSWRRAALLATVCCYRKALLKSSLRFYHFSALEPSTSMSSRWSWCIQKLTLHFFVFVLLPTEKKLHYWILCSTLTRILYFWIDCVCACTSI